MFIKNRNLNRHKKWTKFCAIILLVTIRLESAKPMMMRVFMTMKREPDKNEELDNNGNNYEKSTKSQPDSDSNGGDRDEDSFDVEHKMATFLNHLVNELDRHVYLFLYVASVVESRNDTITGGCDGGNGPDAIDWREFSWFSGQCGTIRRNWAAEVVNISAKICRSLARMNTRQIVDARERFRSTNVSISREMLEAFQRMPSSSSSSSAAASSFMPLSGECTTGELMDRFGMIFERYKAGHAKLGADDRREGMWYIVAGVVPRYAAIRPTINSTTDLYLRFKNPKRWLSTLWKGGAIGAGTVALLGGAGGAAYHSYRKKSTNKPIFPKRKRPGFNFWKDNEAKEDKMRPPAADDDGDDYSGDQSKSNSQMLFFYFFIFALFLLVAIGILVAVRYRNSESSGAKFRLNANPKKAVHKRGGGGNGKGNGVMGRGGSGGDFRSSNTTLLTSIEKCKSNFDAGPAPGPGPPSGPGPGPGSNWRSDSAESAGKKISKIVH